METILQQPNSNTASKKQFWQEYVSLRQKYKCSKAAYCRKHKLNYDQFIYWEKKLTRSSSQLLPVKLNIQGQIKSTLLCTLKLTNGTELKVYDNTSLPIILSMVS